MDANKDQTSILGNAKPSQAIVKLALPATLALLAKAVYNIVDTAYIGMLGSDIALTAVGVTVPLLLIMVSIENIFAAGAAVLAGRQLGAKDEEGATPVKVSLIVRNTKSEIIIQIPPLAEGQYWLSVTTQAGAGYSLVKDPRTYKFPILLTVGVGGGGDSESPDEI